MLLLFFGVDATAAWVFFSGRDILHPLWHTCTKLNRIAHFRTENRDFFLSRFFPFLCVWFEPLLSLAVIHPPQKSKGFYAVGCTFPASPFSAGEPSSPVNPPRPFLPACNIAQSPYRFLCACVLLLSIFHPFPHVFLMCSRTHIVLILPLSHPVCVCVWCWNKDVVDERYKEEPLLFIFHSTCICFPT
jgi:hypothetical protein